MTNEMKERYEAAFRKGLRPWTREEGEGLGTREMTKAELLDLAEKIVHQPNHDSEFSRQLANIGISVAPISLFQ
jgi:hypothetical protein